MIIMINEQYKYSDLTSKIIGCAMTVHRIKNTNQLNHKNQKNYSSDNFGLAKKEIKIVESVCTMIFMIHMIALIKGWSLNQLNHTNQMNYS